VRKIFLTYLTRSFQKRHTNKLPLLVTAICFILLPLFSAFSFVGAQTPAESHWEALTKNRIAVWTFSPNFATDSVMFYGTSVQEKMSVRGVYQSADRGSTWKMTSDGLNPKKRNYYTTLVASPDFAQDKTLWLFGHKTGLETQEAFGGFWESTDGGLTWNEIDYKGFPYRELTQRYSQDVLGIVISPKISQDGLMVAAAGGEGIYISKDKGRNWELLYEMKDIINIYAPSSYPDEPFLAAATSGNKVMISTDGGKTFTKQSSGFPDSMNMVSGIAFSGNFTADRKMFCFGAGGLFQSSDAGTTWTALATADTSVNIISMAVYGDFKELGAIVYGTDDSKVYLSEDMGKTFTSIGAETLMRYKVDTVAFSPDYAITHQLFASSQDGTFRYGPVQNVASGQTAEANAAMVESTRNARSTAAAGVKFVSQQSNRVETGCIAYSPALACLVVMVFVERRKKGLPG
jgi:photosystem II stability/assembly factor-like uncharacterized protein